MFRYERIEKRSGTQVLIETPEGEPLVTVNPFGRGRVIFCALPDLLGEDERLTPFAAHLLVHLFSTATPVRVSGEVEYLLNRTSRGWIITLINNRGVLKPQQGLAQVDRSARADVTLSLSGKGIEQARDWMNEKAINVIRDGGQDIIRLTIPPGGISIVELIERR